LIRVGSEQLKYSPIPTTILLDDFLNASNDSVFEHDFDAMRMMRGFGEDPLNNPLRELSAALVLLLHHTHLYSRLDLRSSLAIHDFIIAQDPMSCIDKSHWIIHDRQGKGEFT
jgi:hypothetical protein